jgi:hypothetical protein
VSAQPAPVPPTVAPLVTLHVWRVRRGAVPGALWRMARDRGRLRRTDGVRFAKLLGTGRERRFGPTAADPTRWAALVVWDDPAGAEAFAATPLARAWRRLAVAECRLRLRPVSSRGAWAGRAPFALAAAPAGRAASAPPQDPSGRAPLDGPVLVLTRARLRARRAVEFWRAIAAPAAELQAAPGLLAAFGIGEAPLGWQGTVSVWRSPADVVRFAYRQPQHRAAVAATPVRRWYTEELFARFAVLGIDGDRAAIGWTDGRDGRG